MKLRDLLSIVSEDTDYIIWAYNKDKSEQVIVGTSSEIQELDPKFYNYSIDYIEIVGEVLDIALDRPLSDVEYDYYSSNPQRLEES